VSQALKDLKKPIAGELKLLRSGGDIVYEEGAAPLSTRTCKAVIDEMKKWATSSKIHEDNSTEVLFSFAPVHLTKGSPQYGFGGTYKSIDHIQGNKGEGWYVLVEQEVREVLVPLFSITKWIAGIGMAIICIMAMVALYLGRKISAPLVYVASVAEEIGKRNFTVRVNLTSKDEVGMLATSINKMVSDLQNTTSSRDELNKLVSCQS